MISISYPFLLYKVPPFFVFVTRENLSKNIHYCKLYSHSVPLLYLFITLYSHYVPYITSFYIPLYIPIMYCIPLYSHRICPIVLSHNISCYTFSHYDISHYIFPLRIRLYIPSHNIVYPSIFPLCIPFYIPILYPTT